VVRRCSLVLAALVLLSGVAAASCAPAGSGPIVASPEPQASCDGAGMREHSYVTSVAANGRYFEDQHGAPIFVFGDSPWAGPVRWSPEQAELYFANREANGFNASIVSLLGSRANGGPADDGATFDGILPFEDGDVTRWNAAYWDRMDTYVRAACAHGNTLFLYPIDGWTVSTVFRDVGFEDAHRYGAMVAERYARFPNIVWMTGGDHFPGVAPQRHDALFEQVLRGIRSTGDTRPFSIQLGYPASLSTDSPMWEGQVDFNFAYTYLPTYRAVLDGYARDALPALLAEANYEGENNLPGTPVTTDVVLRRQMAWALTSGSPGYFYGSDDWEFLPGWEGRLDTAAVRQLGRLRAFFASLDWWALVPDESAEIITAGRGEPVAEGAEVGVMDNDRTTAARVGDTLIAYVPTGRTLTVDPAKLAQPPTARWVDAADATAAPVVVGIDPSGAVATPGRNAAGGEDWLLLLRLR
jgi:hypothetical protein